MAEGAKKIDGFKNAVTLFAFIFVIWGFYRLILFEFPLELTELIVKPVVWLLPVFYFLRKEKEGIKSIGISFDGVFNSFYLVIILGVIFAIEGFLVNYLKYQSLNFSAYIGEQSLVIGILITLATAITEETVFRGYIFTRFWALLGNEWLANIVVAVCWVMVHLPIAIFDWRLSLVGILSLALLHFLYAVGATFVFARTKNIFSVILLHILWSWPVILFR